MSGLPPHGQRVRYTRHGCRCTVCHRANLDYKIALRARRKAGVPVRAYTRRSA